MNETKQIKLQQQPKAQSSRDYFVSLTKVKFLKVLPWSPDTEDISKLNV